MALEKGDYNVYSDEAVVVTRESDGSGTAGDAVAITGGQVTPTADGDTVYGVLAEDAPSAGENVAVVVKGDVIVNAGGSVVAGNAVETGATAGQLVNNASGTEISVDEGGTATYTISIVGKAHLGSGGTLPDGNALGTNEAVVELY